MMFPSFVMVDNFKVGIVAGKPEVGGKLKFKKKTFKMQAFIAFGFEYVTLLFCAHAHAFYYVIRSKGVGSKNHNTYFPIRNLSKK